MTQGELADALGIRFQQVQKYESGANRISASRLWDIGHALQVPIAYFYDGLPDSVAPVENAQVAGQDLSEASMMIQYYSNMTNDERRRLRTLTKEAEQAPSMLPSKD